MIDLSDFYRVVKFNKDFWAIQYLSFDNSRRNGQWRWEYLFDGDNKALFNYKTDAEDQILEILKTK